MADRLHFTRLIGDFCQLCGLKESQRILQGGPIAVDDVVFSLVYSEEVDPSLLFIYTDQGEVPPGHEAKVHRALLEMNLRLYTGRGPAFALSEESGRVVRADHRPLAKLTHEHLLALLREIAAGAKAWREDPAFEKLVPQARRSGLAAAWPTAKALGWKPRDVPHPVPDPTRGNPEG